MSETENTTEKLSAAELVKYNSHHLRGTIAKELLDDSDKFDKDNAALLKFHGTYQQDDREQRKSKDGTKSARTYIFMVRTAVPGGRLTGDQLLAELDICDELGNSSLRITSRQGLQHHGIPKHAARSALHQRTSAAGGGNENFRAAVHRLAIVGRAKARLRFVWNFASVLAAPAPELFDFSLLRRGSVDEEDFLRAAEQHRLRHRGDGE